MRDNRNSRTGHKKNKVEEIYYTVSAAAAKKKVLPIQNRKGKQLAPQKTMQRAL